MRAPVKPFVFTKIPHAVPPPRSIPTCARTLLQPLQLPSLRAQLEPCPWAPCLPHRPPPNRARTHSPRPTSQLAEEQLPGVHEAEAEAHDEASKHVEDAAAQEGGAAEAEADADEVAFPMESSPEMVTAATPPTLAVALTLAR